MKIKDLFTWRGEIDRVAYLLWGCLLLGVKTHLDRYLPWLLGYRERLDSFLEILFRYAAFGPLPNLFQSGVNRYFLVLLWIALPFIYMGLCLTFKRLRSAGLPPGLVVLFFVPYLNILFFIMLSLLVSQKDVEAAARKGRPQPWYAKYIPHTKLGSAAIGWLVTVCVCLIIAVVVIYGLRRYGWTLFVGVPFFGGLISALFYGFHQPRPLKETLGVSMMSGVLMGLTVLMFAMEGLICVMMASPLVGTLSLMGGFVGFLIQHRDAGESDLSRASCSILLFLPFSAAFEGRMPLPPATVVSEIEIAAPAELIWQNLVAFPPIAEKRSWLFHTGIAYPTHAIIEGAGVGAVRYCHFSTGAFVEPIEIWDPPHHLAFGVTASPDPMREMFLFGESHPPHLKGYLRVERGAFQLEPMGSGKFRLIGTTWYRQDLWPNFYWRLWTDWIVHKIHLRVLEHIRIVSETPAREN